MTIRPASEDPVLWNSYIEKHYPPVGAFMQTWEWGEFQKKLGRDVSRWVVVDGSTQVAAFMLVRFTLPGGLSYGYVPRGPVIANPEQAAEVLCAVRAWAAQEMPHFIFIRLEPPLETLPDIKEDGWHVPPYYVQPRRNTIVTIPESADDLARSFHSSTRSNLGRAEKRGVTAKLISHMGADERAAFAGMIRETVKRNHGVNAYPSSFYFDMLLAALPMLGEQYDPRVLSVAAFCGYQEGTLASMHLVLFFGKTATYLYGATRTNHLSSKVDTYLHWVAMREAHKRGCRYYDLGGVDEARWPSLTTFKRQFSKDEQHYAGNIDILLRPRWYQAYALLRKLKK